MNFSADDPLGDLLSEDDSFFDEPKVHAPPFRKATPPTTTTKTEKKSVSDLFGLDLDKPKKPEPKSAAAQKDDWLGLGGTTSNKPLDKPNSAVIEQVAQSSTTGRNTPSKMFKKISFEDDKDGDLLAGLGVEKKQSTTKGTDLFDDILGTKRKDEAKGGGLFDDLLATKKPELPVLSKPAQAKPDAKDEQPLGLLGGGRESRRPRTAQTAMMDPLGLLGSTSNETPVRRHVDTLPTPKTEVLLAPKEKTKSTPNVSDLPDWLEGARIKANVSEAAINKLGTQESMTGITRSSSVTKFEDVASVTTIAAQSMESLHADEGAVLTQQKITSANIEYQNTALALQQQESQVLMALQLRKYEQSMADLQRQQQEVLIKQEQSFNTLLDRQFAKQQLIENNIRLQQERINNHIQMLVTQQPRIEMTSADAQRADEDKGRTDELRRLYEGMVTALKQRHHEETFLMEESYKKQLTTLDQSMEATEARLKQEIDAIVLINSTKLEALKDEHSAQIELYKAKIEDLRHSHIDEITALKLGHDRVINEIKREHELIVDNIKRSRTVESNVMEESGEIVQKLDHSLRALEINSRSLACMQDDLVKKYGIVTSAREETMKAKENELNLMRAALEKSREQANNDQSQLMALIRTLELKIADQQQDAREERFALQQATATISARSATLDREAEFNRSCLEREREQLKALKETLLAEQEQVLLRLTEDKLAVAAEKSRLDITAKLSTSTFSEQRARAEVDAAVQTARDAAERAEIEREQMQRRAYELDALKRSASDRERKLMMRERELEVLQRNAEQRSREGEESLVEAQMVRAQHAERLKQLQQQLRSLAEREKRLATDKIELSRERLQLHGMARSLKRCSLCRVEQQQQQLSGTAVGRGPHDVQLTAETDDESNVEHDIPKFISVNDAELFRMQLKMSEDQLTQSHNADVED